MCGTSWYGWNRRFTQTLVLIKCFIIYIEHNHGWGKWIWRTIAFFSIVLFLEVKSFQFSHRNQNDKTVLGFLCAQLYFPWWLVFDRTLWCHLIHVIDPHLVRKKNLGSVGCCYWWLNFLMNDYRLISFVWFCDLVLT